MTPIPPPASVPMLFLAALDLGLPHRTEAGGLYVDVPGAGPQPVGAADLDWLEGRSWLDLSGEEPRVTDAGRYWAERWAKTHHKRGRRA